MQKILKCAHHLHETEEKTIDDEGMAGEGGGETNGIERGTKNGRLRCMEKSLSGKLDGSSLLQRSKKKLTVVVIAVRIKHNDDSSFKLINEKSANLKIIHTSMNFAEF